MEWSEEDNVGQWEEIIYEEASSIFDQEMIQMPRRAHYQENRTGPVLVEPSGHYESIGHRTGMAQYVYESEA